MKTKDIGDQIAREAEMLKQIGKALRAMDHDTAARALAAAALILNIPIDKPIVMDLFVLQPKRSQGDVSNG